MTSNAQLRSEFKPDFRTVSRCGFNWLFHTESAGGSPACPSLYYVFRTGRTPALPVMNLLVKSSSARCLERCPKAKWIADKNQLNIWRLTQMSCAESES